MRLDPWQFVDRSREMPPKQGSGGSKMQQTVFPCSVFSVHEVLVGKLMMDSGWRLKSRREKREINTRDSFHTVWSQSPDLRVFFFASSFFLLLSSLPLPIHASPARNQDHHFRTPRCRPCPFSAQPRPLHRSVYSYVCVNCRSVLSSTVRIDTTVSCRWSISSPLHGLIN